jgi:putative (di)nucleoside polyphosphate hydrolase
MNKNQIIKHMKKLNLPIDEYWILAGSALVMHGIRPETSDIDIGCTTVLFESLIGSREVIVREDGSRSLDYDGVLEVFENWMAEEVVTLNELPVGSLISIKNHKEMLNREKDKKDLELINKRIRRAVGAIIKKEDKYLIVNKVKAFDTVDLIPTEVNEWDLIKGGIDQSDIDLHAALRRELEEETGSIDFKIIKQFNKTLNFDFEMASPIARKYHMQITNMFLVEYTGENEVFQSADGEIGSYKFVTEDELLNQLSHGNTIDFIRCNLFKV